MSCWNILARKREAGQQLHTKLYHPQLQHLHKSGQYVPPVQRGSHCKIRVIEIGEVGDGGGGLRGIWRLEVSWHGVGQLSGGADVKNCEIKRIMLSLVHPC